MTCLDVITQTRAVPSPRPKPCEDPCPEGHAAHPDANPDHHLWRNGRLWWAAFSLLLDGWRQERVRCSLGTADILEARRRRDALFAHYTAIEGCELRLRPATVGFRISAIRH